MFYIPLPNITYDANGLPTGEDLYVVPSNALTTAPLAITKDHLGLYGQMQAVNQKPSGLLYSTKGAPNGDHVYYLSLNAASAPAPVQASNLTLNASQATTYCAGNLFGLANLSNAASGFVVIQIAGADNKCYTSDDQYLLVNANAAPTAAPVTLPITGNYTFEGTFFNSSGQLDGVLGSDSQGNLRLYADQTFASSKLLFPATAGQTTSYGVLADFGNFAFVTVQTGTAPNTVSKVYRIDQSGAVSAALYTSQTNGSFLGAGATDQNNLYFTDGTPSGTLINVVQLAISGASPGVVLYADNFGSLPTGSNVTLSLVGSTGTRLVLNAYQHEFSPSGGINDSGVLETLTVGQANGTPTVIANAASNSFFVNAQLQNSLLYTTQQTYSNVSSPSGATVSYAEEILQLNGTVVSNTANAAITGFTVSNNSTGLPFGNYVVDHFLVAQGITANDSSYGGGTLYSAPLSGSATPLQTPNGQNLVFPSAYGTYLYGITPNIGQGIGYRLQDAALTSVPPGYLFDLSKSLVVQLPVLN